VKVDQAGLDFLEAATPFDRCGFGPARTRVKKKHKDRQLCTVHGRLPAASA